jgi:hypothetical protein
MDQEHPAMNGTARRDPACKFRSVGMT